MEATMLNTGFTIAFALAVIGTCLYYLKDKE